jgi:hypothetical protein
MGLSAMDGGLAVGALATHDRPDAGGPGAPPVGRARRAARGEIIEAHKKLITQVHPDRGGDVALVHEANDARDLLLARLEPEKRA